jgi:LEA14-like dessication related protein
MDKVRICLALISVAITAGPICGALIIYRDNLLAVVIPPQASDLLTDFTNKSPNATFVEYYYNASSQSVTLKINVTNPYSFDLTINSFSADVECREHHYHLGNVTSNVPQNIPKNSFALISVVMIWTQDAAKHFQTSHLGESSIFVDLVDSKVDVQGIAVQLQSRESIPDPIPIP